MKTKREIMEIVLEEFKNHIHKGLCQASYVAHNRGNLSWHERYIFKNYLYAHKPFIARLTNSLFFWEQYKKRPRIKWLEKHIKQLEKRGIS